MEELLQVLDRAVFGVFRPERKVTGLGLRFEDVAVFFLTGKKLCPLRVHPVNQIHGDRVIGDHRESGGFQGMAESFGCLGASILDLEHVHGAYLPPRIPENKGFLSHFRPI